MQNKILTVKYHGDVVGRLALTPDNLMAFEYDTDWLKNGYSSSEYETAFFIQLVAKAEAAGYEYGWWNYNDSDKTYTWQAQDNQANIRATWTDTEKAQNIQSYLNSGYFNNDKNPQDFPVWVTDEDGVYYSSYNDIWRGVYNKAADAYYKAVMASLTSLQVGPSYSYYRSYYNNFVGYADGYQSVTGNLVGVFYQPIDVYNYNSNSTIVIDDQVYGEIGAASGGKYAFAIAPMNQSNLKNIVRWAYDNIESNGDRRTKFFLKAGPMELLETVNDLLEELAKVFLWVGVGLAVFAGLLMMNYIATTISYKKREIGILRAVGARSFDVFTIFLNESVIIAVINFILAAAATFGVVFYLNNMLRTEYKITLTLLNFGFRQIGLILAIALVVAALASAIPVFNISRKKPIDAIRSE